MKEYENLRMHVHVYYWKLSILPLVANMLVIYSLHTIMQMVDLRYMNIIHPNFLKAPNQQSLKSYRQLKQLFFSFFFPSHASFIALLENQTVVKPMACLPYFTFHKLTLLMWHFHVSFEQPPSLGARGLRLKSKEINIKLAGPQNSWEYHKKRHHWSKGETCVNTTISAYQGKLS